MDLMDILSSATSSSTKVEKKSYKINIGDMWLCSITLDVNNKRNNPLHSALSEKQTDMTSEQMVELLTALLAKASIEVSTPKISEKLDLSALL